jgi:hypothetical protein
VTNGSTRFCGDSITVCVTGPFFSAFAWSPLKSARRAASSKSLALSRWVCGSDPVKLDGEILHNHTHETILEFLPIPSSLGLFLTHFFINST